MSGLRGSVVLRGQQRRLLVLLGTDSPTLFLATAHPQVDHDSPGSAPYPGDFAVQGSSGDYTRTVASPQREGRPPLSGPELRQHSSSLEHVVNATLYSSATCPFTRYVASSCINSPADEQSSRGHGYVTWAARTYAQRQARVIGSWHHVTMANAAARQGAQLAFPGRSSSPCPATAGLRCSWAAFRCAADLPVKRAVQPRLMGMVTLEMLVRLPVLPDRHRPVDYSATPARGLPLARHRAGGVRDALG